MTMPFYLGYYEPRSVIVKVPSIWKSIQNERDTANLHALMSTPVTCTLPLMDLLKVRPDLWERVARCLTEQGFWDKKTQVGEIMKPATIESSPSTKIKVLVNKVGGKAKDDKENTTLPIMINKVESIDILDSGGRVGIGTRKIWEAWDKPALRQTWMNL